MKSIKPGRGPSAMGGIGSIFAAIFGIFWTFSAASMGAPIFFILFGVGFVILGIVQAVYRFNNATAKNRFSAFDITDSSEESDPLQELVEGVQSSKTAQPSAYEAHETHEGRFCPYCGAEAQPSFSFCEKCGKQLSSRI